VSRERKQHYPDHDGNVVPEALARMAESRLTANEVDRRRHGQRVNHDRTEHDSTANCQWQQDRDVIGGCRC